MIYKIGFTGLFFLLVGVIALLIENSFYQYIDTVGRLHESLFLPLGALSLIVGAALVFIFIINRALKFLLGH